jgi:hypothetical protein
MTDPSAIERFYRERDADLTRQAVTLERRRRRVEIARLVVFASAVATLVWVLARGAGRAGPLWIGMAVIGVIFVAMVIAHGRLARRETHVRDRALLARAGVHRIRRDWDALRDSEWLPPVDHPYAADLDLFGHASLDRLLPPTTPFPGTATIRSWLLEPTSVADARERQRAVAELRPLVGLRDDLAIEGGRVWGAPRRIEHFIEWAETPGAVLTVRPWLVWASRLVPSLTIALGLAHGAGFIERSLWVVPLSASIALSAAFSKRLISALRRALPESEVLSRYAELLRIIAAARFGSSLLRDLQARASSGAKPAHAQITGLVTIMRAAEIWRSPMLYLPLQLVLLWDFHLVFMLERWQRRAGRDVRRWLAALGSVEALSALATLAHDNPDWAWPELTESGPPVLEATDLGHPLLAAAARVANDVSVGPPGTFLLVTGSNMAGKSTLIRSIGLNVVLAQCGAPVCAASLRCPPLAVHTSIRVQDSLEQGVSFFMAELQRLKQVVDAAEAAPRAGRTLLYLLDEILQGTNSDERTIAARRIVGHLVAAGAIGAVTTHDLALASGEALTRARTDVHFTEQFGPGADGGAVMTFDYRLRPGVATSTNALKLLEIVGLPASDPPL